MSEAIQEEVGKRGRKKGEQYMPPDPEVSTISRACKMLDALGTESAIRVIDYLRGRYYKPLPFCGHMGSSMGSSEFAMSSHGKPPQGGSSSAPPRGESMCESPTH